MILSNIQLKNMRLYNDKAFKFNSTINIVCGSNAKGKTTILEAINYLITTRSNRTNNDYELVSYLAQECLIKGTFYDTNNKKTAIVLISNNYKKMSIDGLVTKKATDYVGFSRVVSFGMQDVNDLSSSPAARRKILDMFICQVDNAYMRLLKDYKTLIKEKNIVLKNDKKDEKMISLLNVLDEKLYSYSQEISKCRLKYVSLINKELNDLVGMISDQHDECDLILSQSIPFGANKDFFIDKRKEDLQYKNCMYGPHRDDYIFNVNGKNVVKFGSQGQKKTIVLALKMAFAKIIKDIFGEYPIILLDDVFGELDSNRQNNLIKLFNNGAQVFITTPSISDINELLLVDANIINLEKEDNYEPR